MKLWQLPISLLCVLSAASLSIANNSYFLPGDAFFFVRLDKESAKQLEEFESPVLHYGSPFNGAAGCGYIGYEKIELTNMAPDVKKAILNACHRFQHQVDHDPELGGKISVFVYSNKYDWKTLSIGMQYNENWVDESVAFGTIRSHTALGSFSSNSIMRNWRDSSLVSALPAECPALPDGHGKTFPTPWSKTPVKIDASKCCFLILPNRDFDSYVNPQNGTALIEIVGGKLTYFERHNGKWRPKK